MKLGAFSISLAVTDLAQKTLKAQGMQLLSEADESTTASFITTDPDGNQILVDQHR